MATLSVLDPAHKTSSVAAKSHDRMRRLVEAAYELLAEEGLEGLTIRAVLARTGLARRAFYERFAGKDDLVLAVFDQTLRAAARQFRDQAAMIEDPAERLRAIIFAIVLGRIGIAGVAEVAASDRRSAALSREHLRLAESHPAELQAALSPLLDLIAEIVTVGIGQGQFRTCDPALQATLIYNLVSTTVHTELLAEEDATPDPARRQHIAGEIWEFCWRAVRA